MEQKVAKVMREFEAGTLHHGYSAHRIAELRFMKQL